MTADGPLSSSLRTCFFQSSDLMTELNRRLNVSRCLTSSCASRLNIFLPSSFAVASAAWLKKAWPLTSSLMASLIRVFTSWLILSMVFSSQSKSPVRRRT